MADDRITGVPARYDDDTTLNRAERMAVDRALPVQPIRHPDHLLPEHASAGVPGQVAATDDPDVARAEIERTRARMSETIDHIESALLRKKEEVQQRLDVMAPVRERPLASVAAVFGAGLALGLLTGGGDENGDDDRGRDDGGDAPRGRMSRMVPTRFRGDAGWKERARSWEERSRELQHVVRRQQELIEEMRARLDEGPYRVEVDLDPDAGRSGLASGGYEGGFDEPGPGSLRDSLLGGIADSIGNACDQWAAGDQETNPRFPR
jgi:hypothetical protein